MIGGRDEDHGGRACELGAVDGGQWAVHCRGIGGTARPGSCIWSRSRSRAQCSTMHNVSCELYRSSWSQHSAVQAMVGRAVSRTQQTTLQESSPDMLKPVLYEYMNR